MEESQVGEDLALKNFLSLPSIILIVVIGFLQVWWPLMTEYEGEIFPVVENVKVSKVRSGPNFVEVSVSFDKVRQCEFLGLSWYNQSGKRIFVVFDAYEQNFPRTRPQGRQDTGIWKLIGTDQLNGTYAIVSHKCYPLWTTFTKFYP